MCLSVSIGRRLRSDFDAAVLKELLRHSNYSSIESRNIQIYSANVPNAVINLDISTFYWN